MDIQLFRFHDINGTNPYELDYLGIVDDFISCTFTRSFVGVGSWRVVISNHNPKLELFKQAQFIKLEDGCCGLINQQETVTNDEANGDTTAFSGEELKSLAYKRIIDTRAWNTGVTSFYMPVGELQEHLLSLNLTDPPDGQDARRIPGIITRENSLQSVRYYPSYKNLGECLVQLGATYDSGWTANIEYGDVSIASPSKQLINPDNLMQDVWIGDNGAIIPMQDRVVSELIPVSVGETIYFYGYSNDEVDKLLYGYDNQGNGVEELGIAPGDDFYEVDWNIVATIPEGVSQIRVNYSKFDQNVMLERGTKTQYEPYAGTITVECNRIVWYTGLRGRDRTINSTSNEASKILLSYGLDNIQTSTYNYNKYIPNTAYVAGQGQGIERALSIINDNTNSGMDRYEIVVDARDIAEVQDLPARGEQALSGYGTNNAYECLASPNITNNYVSEILHTTDSINLGDYITVKDDTVDVQFDIELQQLTIIYDEDGSKTLELQLGKFAETLTDNLSQMSNDTEELIRNNYASALPVDIEGKTYITSPLTIKGTEETYVDFQPLDTYVHTNLYSGSVGANASNNGVGRYVYMQNGDTRLKLYREQVNDIGTDTKHINDGVLRIKYNTYTADDIVLTRDNFFFQKQLTKMDYKGTVHWSTNSTLPVPFSAGTWTKIGSITVGNKTVYAYEKTSQ